LYQDLYTKVQVNNNLVNSGRPASAFPVAVPPAYTVPGGVTANLYLLYRYANYIGAMLNNSPCWFGAWQMYSSIAVGSNNIDPFTYEAQTDAYWSMAATKELRPAYDRQRNVLTVPFPTISDTFVTDDWYTIMITDNAFPNPAAYGGATLDLLNSEVGGTLVCLVNGPTLKDDKGYVKIADGTYGNMVPNSSSIPVNAVSETKAVETTQILTDTTNNADRKQILSRILGSFILDPKKRDVAINTWFLNKKNRPPVITNTIIRFPSIGIVQTGEEGKMLEPVVRTVTNRTSPSTTLAMLIGVTSAEGFDEGRKLETVMQTPISGYTPYPFGPLIERLVHGDQAAFYPGSGAKQAVTFTDITTAPTFVLDPTSNTKNDVAVAMLQMSDNFKDKKMGVGSMISDVSDTAPPRARRVGKAVGTIVTGLEKSIGKKIQQKRQQKGKKKLWVNLQ